MRRRDKQRWIREIGLLAEGGEMTGEEGTSKEEFSPEKVTERLEELRQIEESLQKNAENEELEETQKKDTEEVLRKELAEKLERINGAEGAGAEELQKRVKDIYGDNLQETIENLRNTESTFENAKDEIQRKSELDKQITDRKMEEMKKEIEQLKQDAAKAGGNEKDWKEFKKKGRGGGAGLLFMTLALAGLARLFYAAFHNNGGCQQHNPAIAAGNLEGGWTSLTSNSASLFTTDTTASENCNGYSCSFCHYLNPPGSAHSAGVNGAPVHLLAPTSPMLQSSNAANQCTMSPELAKTNLMAARMQQYDCLNRVNYPLCSPKPMKAMCENVDEDTCKNVKPVNRICTYKPDTGCTIRDDFQNLTPSWEASPENTFGQYYAFNSHTVPQDAQLAYVEAQGSGPPPLGQTGGAKFAPASAGMISTAQWCHNAGGLWLANTEDKDQVMAGWGCVSPPGPSGDSTVKFVGDDFAAYQTQLGLGSDTILAKNTGLVCSSDTTCKTTYDNPTKPPSSPAATLIDYYDCMKGDDNKWIPIQNNPCHGCTWYDMWGLYEAEQSIAATTKIGKMFQQLFDFNNWKKVLIVVVIVIACCILAPRLISKLTGK